jgi:hypothetical protein
MKYVIAILAGLGAALLAGVAGLALLHGTYEAAWAFDLDGPLRHTLVYYAFVGLPALVAFTAMAWRVARPRGGTGFKAEAGAILATALAGLGGGALGYVIADTYAFEFWKAMGQDGLDLKNSLVSSLVFGSLLMFALGIVLGTIHHRRDQTRSETLWSGMLAGGAALLTLFAVMIVAKTFSDSRYERGVHVVARYEIRLPANTALPKKDDVRVEMVAAGEARQGFFYDPWQMRDGRPVVRGAVWLNRPIAQRTLVVSVPGEPKRIFRLGLPAKPAASEEFGPWQKADFVAPLGEPRRAPTGAEGDVEIRYHAN